MSSSVINKTTFAHIARLVWNSSGKILKVIVDTDFDMTHLRRLVIGLAREIENNIFQAVLETKRLIFESDIIDLTFKESDILRQAVVTITTTVSLLIYYMIYYLKRLLSSFIETMGMADLINGILATKKSPIAAIENVVPSPENEIPEKQNQDI